MPEQNQTQPDLASEFRKLGDNLKNILQSSWESAEAQKLRQDVKEGLNQLGQATNQAVKDFEQSEAGQRLKAEAQDLKERIESGEVEAKARSEISNVLHTLNQELEKAVNQISKREQQDE